MASDNAVWRVLFLTRWKIDLSRALLGNHEMTRNARVTLGMTWDVGMIDIGAKAKRVLGLSASTAVSGNTPIATAPLQLDWRTLYRDRLELDLRWSGATDHPIFRDTGITRLGRGSNNNSSFLSAGSKGLGVHRRRGYEPKRTRISGHFDR